MAAAIMAASLLLCLVGLELGLRAYKSLGYDGLLWLRSPSVNNVVHPEYGWLSPPNTRITKADPCFGSGTVSYNSTGFRAPELTEAAGADLVVCILGDSTVHGYQLPDGAHLPYLLADGLKAAGVEAYVLPLAVGGYGSVQQWLLYRDFCRPLQPDVIIQHWTPNDPLNNSFEGERYGGAARNNARPRPYLVQPASEGVVTELRSPYPVSITPGFDDLLVVRALNSIWLELDARTETQLGPAWEEGWAVARTLTERLAAEPGRKLALVAADRERALAMYEEAGWETAIHPPLTPDLTCAPRDPHANSAGHKLLAEALLAALRRSAH